MAECLKEIGKFIITQCLLPPIKHHVDYWWCFDNNIKGLTDGIQDLERKIYDMNQKIEEARLRTDRLRPGVEEWSKAGNEKLEEATRILQDGINPKAWNLISRYSIGKRAKKAAEEIAKHQNDGNNFNVVADPAPPPAMGSTPPRSTVDFVSRKRIEEDIIKSLKESSVGMVGICGMGGVGKTTMAERIRERVKKEKLFDEVVMVVVSQQIDTHKIQEEIADLLKLEFDTRSMSARADKLRSRLMDTKRKIIIFDDVWERLKLEDLGVSFESGFERCKILLTSRFKDVCDKMEAKIIPMEILTKEEAWILFKEKAGHCVENLTLRPVAEDVVAECNGLPIALVTVGEALRNREKSIWEDSLSQLRRSNPADFPELLTDVYKPLKLSYDKLDNESERLLFLICCLFPEDYAIPVEQLARQIMGLKIIDDVTSIEGARNRTCRLVDKLKSRFLLIDGGEKNHVKMHDVVRDVAIFIGSKEKYGFLKSLNKLSIESSTDINCNWMSVAISNEPVNVDMGLCFPKLRLLMLLNLSSDRSLKGSLSSDISLEGIGDLNVLSFSDIWIESLPPTLGLLQNLRTLLLYSCEVEDISVIGKLTGLEILHCYNCDEIKELPKEIGRLNRLRLLELNYCSNLCRIAFGILSSLVRLEELRMLDSFVGWEAEENGKEMRNASVRELESLPNLTCLEIEISDYNLAAQEIGLPPNLVKYRICVGDCLYGEGDDYEKVMKFDFPSEIGAVGKWIQILLKNTEWLYLKGDGSNNINVEECQELRNLSVTKCSTLKKVVKTKDCKSSIVFPMLERLHLYELENLEEICDGTITLNQNVSSLCNLKSVEIRFCSKLRSLFSVSVATTCLLQLEFLKIKECEAMEQVFRNDITDGCIEFPKLKELELTDLPNLTIILNQNVSSLCNLKSVLIISCFKLRYLFSVSVATTCLLQLEVLDIFGCEAMEEVFRNDITDSCIEFPKLKLLELRDLPNLTAFSQGLQTIKFPNLTKMSIGGLPKLNSSCALNSETPHDDKHSFHFLCNPKVEIGGLKTLHVWNFKCNNIRNIWCHQIPINIFNNLKKLYFYEINGIRSIVSLSIAKNLVSLKHLLIWSCKEMVEVIEGNDDDKEIVHLNSVFPTLKKLEFRSLPKLRRFWQWNHALELPMLEQVSIENCLAMETFTMGSLNTPNLKMLEINWKEIDDAKDLNDILHHHFRTKNQNTSMIEKLKEDEDANKDEDKDEN